MADSIEERLTNLERQMEQLQGLLSVMSGMIPAMVYIPGGTFQMGSKERNEEQPVHQVSVAPFYISRFVITQAQWRAVTTLPKINGDLNPEPLSGLSDNFKGEQLPIIEVTWYGAKEFCARLSLATGHIYRLPTEAEWEYACRAGTTTEYNFGDEITQEQANYEGHLGCMSPAGKYPPNTFGLYDMHGNVWEWCEDTWHDSYNRAPTKGSAWVDEDDDRFRVMRGGSWINHTGYCRSAYRNKEEPDHLDYNVGFRVVCV